MPLGDISRSGSFGGIGNLDPFGSSRGGLGRYNLGSDIGTIDAYEAYVIAIGWQNGSVTDAEYLASLKKQWDRAPSGTKEQQSAKDKYEDAVYTIERNKIVSRVNLATSSAERVAGLRALNEHDKARASGMTQDNEQRRELAGRIMSTDGDIRQAEYGDLVEKYNAGKATTAELIAFVTTAITASQGAPDADDWMKTRTDLVDRQNDEVTAQRQQDYQQGRDPGGVKLLATYNAQLAGLTPGSPKYETLMRSREDLTKQVRAEALSKHHADTYNKYQQGKITDAQFLKDLEDTVKEAPAGSREAIEAKATLVQYRFSLAEDAIRDGVDRGVRPKSDLIRFYQGYLRSMVPGSYRARQIAGAIRALQASGSGGGGGSSSKGIAGLGKLITVPQGWRNVISSTTKDVNGRPVPKGALEALLRFNASDPFERNWYGNNRRTMDFAIDQGHSTWLFVDKKGNTYELALDPDLYGELLKTGEASFRAWADHARTPKEAQTATGQWMTATQRLTAYAQETAMDEYEGRFDYLERRKKDALATGDYASYITYLNAQQILVRETAGISGDPAVVATDIANATAAFTPEQLQRIAADIDKISPFEPDPANPNGDPLNMRGDKVAWAMNQVPPVITYKSRVTDTGEMETYDVQLNRDRAYFTQTAYGTVDLVVDAERPNDFARVQLDSGIDVPAYQLGAVPAEIWTGSREVLQGQIRPDQESNQTVWVKPTYGDLKGLLSIKTNGSGEIVSGRGAPLAVSNTGAPAFSRENPYGPFDNSAGVTQNRLVNAPSEAGGIPLWSMRVYGWQRGGTKGWATWVSTQKPGTAGALWMQVPNGGGQGLRVVLDPDSPWASKKGLQYTIKDNKLVMLNADGSTAELPADFDWGAVTRFYNNTDATGPASAGMGVPGADSEWTLADYTGKVNVNRTASRPESELRETYGPNGELRLRTYNDMAASDAEAAAHMRRIRGAGVNQKQRNLDTQAYYDRETQRWKSGPAKREGTIRGRETERLYEDPTTLNLPAAGARSAPPARPTMPIVSPVIEEDRLQTPAGARSSIKPPPKAEPLLPPSSPISLPPPPTSKPWTPPKADLEKGKKKPTPVVKVPPRPKITGGTTGANKSYSTKT